MAVGFLSLTSCACLRSMRELLRVGRRQKRMLRESRR